MHKLAVVVLAALSACATDPMMGMGKGSGSGSGVEPEPLPATAFAYVHGGSAGDSIGVIDMATGSNTTYSLGNDKVDGIAVSHDRKHIAFTGLIGIYVIGVDGSNLHPLAEIYTSDELGISGPEWSPDDSTIYLAFGQYSGGVGGETLSVVPATGGMIQMLQPAQTGNDCSGITDPKFSLDGSFLYVQHSVCVNGAHEGLWKHSPDGAGTEYLAKNDFELAKPVILSDGTVLALGNTGGVNGIEVIRNGAIAGSVPPPSGYSMDSITASPDGTTLVIAGHDLATFKKDLYATTDFQTYTPLTTDGASTYPAF